MLVYVRVADYHKVMRPISQDEIPRHLVTRFKEEDEERMRKLREKREAHMYIEIMVARDFNVCEFRTYGFKDMDFVNWMEGPGPPTPPTPPKSAAPAAPTGRASQSRSSKPEFHPLCSI